MRICPCRFVAPCGTPDEACCRGFVKLHMEARMMMKALEMISMGHAKPEMVKTFLLKLRGGSESVTSDSYERGGQIIR